MERFQFAGGALQIGDEFGPYLIKADVKGHVLAVFETKVDGKVVRSPDRPAVLTPTAPNVEVKFEVRRPKGFGGMAASQDGKQIADPAKLSRKPLPNACFSSLSSPSRMWTLWTNATSWWAMTTTS